MENNTQRLFAKFYYRVKDSPDLPKELFVIALIALVGLCGFGLGRLSALEGERKKELKVLQLSHVIEGDGGEVGESGEERKTGAISPGMYVGSSNGTTYHLPWCSGAQRIKEDNKTWFASKEEALAKGYKPAANCKGI